LSGIPLQPLFEELQQHELLIHDMDYDLRILRRAGLSGVGTVFDTMLAARLTGSREFGLAALLKQHFGIVIGKGSQKADWARRPLTPQMAEYATNDTRHLPELATRLEAELRRLDRWNWFTQSCEKARDNTLVQRERNNDELWRIPGSDALRGKEAAVLRALWGWRDGEARQVDRPPFHVMRNELMIMAAQSLAARSTAEIPHLTGRRRMLFMEAAEKALALPEDAWPERRLRTQQRLTGAEERRVTELKRIRDTAANQLQIEPALIAPRSMLEALATDPESATARLLPWQRQLLHPSCEPGA
ncbi:MAG: HRDC domain-containing protein, partial [bacterium]